MPVYYSLADVFVTYSYASEGFGLTPIEAIACGTPVICSTLPAYKEILEDHAIFVEPQRPDLLSDTFLRFFKDPSINKILLSTAQKFIQRYTWDAVTDRVESVYETFLQGQRK
jgi:glycosyltransferase involved in cell wall biosynthesis